MKGFDFLEVEHKGKSSKCGMDKRYTIINKGDDWDPENKYIGVFPLKNLREIMQWAGRRFVKGTFIITYYVPSKYYNVQVLREEAFYWAKTTDENICGNCGLCKQRDYKDGSTHFLCRRADNYASLKSTSMGNTCVGHMSNGDDKE